MGNRVKGGWVLGIWDGHDAGAALVRGERFVAAVGEERLTRRKLEVGFPERAVAACLEDAGIGPEAVGHVAASTADPAKTLTRLVPSLKEEYYRIRRRKKDPSPLDGLKKRFKYRFTELPPNPLSRTLSRRHLRGRLRAMGFRRPVLHLLDHHRCHAEAAARCSGLDRCLVVTLDGVGDGLCGSLWIFEDSRLRRVAALPAGASLGIFFEHVTHLMNMRELEDEGKVMALANYAYPVADADNPLLPLMRCRGLGIASPYRSNRLFREMKKIHWRYPSEQFAFMAQRVLEKRVIELVTRALDHTGQRNLALAGGLFSNIKLNMKLAELPRVEHLRVFPHMGDGGLAMGAAVAANHDVHGVAACPLAHLYLGPAAVPGNPADRLEDGDLRVSPLEDPARAAADLILSGEIVFWCQGRAEIGPRALGNRSILARADDRGVRDRLNLTLKRRVWYQPFCPSMLLEEAPRLLHTEHQEVADNRFMTTGYRVRREHLTALEGVVNVDGTCRPHFVGAENPRYRELLMHVRKAGGAGVVLNTSFNVHGDPMVHTARDAVETLRRTGARYLVLEDRLVENLQAA